MLYERQQDDIDKDFTLHGQASLQTKFLSPGPLAVLYRAMRWQGAGSSSHMGNKKYCPEASKEWKESPWYVLVLLNKQTQEDWWS